MREYNNEILFSPSDLVCFVASPYASWMERQFFEFPDSNPLLDDESAEERLIKDAGIQHEKQYLTHLVDSEGRIIEIDTSNLSTALAQTDRAINADEKLIYQAALRNERFSGFADFLILGQNGKYEIWDTKLTCKPEPHHLLQLLCYVDMLEWLTGQRSDTIGIITENNEKACFRTNDFYDYYLQVRAEFLDFMNKFPIHRNPPVPNPLRNHGRWNSSAQQYLQASDHLVGIAGMSFKQASKLEAVGIDTIEKLAKSGCDSIPGLGNQPIGEFKAQAKIRVETRNQLPNSPPLFQLLPLSSNDPHRGLASLPPQSQNDIYLKILSYPEGKNRMGFLITASGSHAKDICDVEMWSHNQTQERASFEKLVDWIATRLKEDPEMHVYHYGQESLDEIRRATGEYATREQQVKGFFGKKIFIDLNAVIRNGVRVGASSYHLEEIEKLYSDKTRSGESSNLMYRAWQISEQSEDWETSDLLRKIRDIAVNTCFSLMGLAAWLRKQQIAAGIHWTPRISINQPSVSKIEKTERKRKRFELAERLLLGLPTPDLRNSLTKEEADQVAMNETLGHLIKYHDRELVDTLSNKSRCCELPDVEGYNHLSCLVGLERTGKKAEKEKQSLLITYGFDPHQESKIKEGDQVVLAENPSIHCEVFKFHRDKSEIVIKIGPGQMEKLASDSQLDRITMIQDDLFISTDTIEEAIANCATSWEKRDGTTNLLQRIILREVPTIAGYNKGDIFARDGETPLETAIRIVPGLQESLVIIQGPPGCGKTFTGGHLIKELLARGKNVGVVSNSHKAITNLLLAANKIMDGKLCGVYKPHSDKEKRDSVFKEIPGLEKYAEHFSGGLIAGTVYLFSKERLVNKIDYLIIDEAGQVCLADLVAMTPCTKNMVLLGDQMQLSHPIRGTHPGETGSSALNYLLGTEKVVPSTRGIFLDTSRRMHPDICNFISEAFYEGRLRPLDGNQNQVLSYDKDLQAKHIRNTSGIMFFPVAHQGNSRASDQEVEAIRDLIKELLGMKYTDRDCITRELNIKEILIIAPYNIQVARLESSLPKESRIGTVDRFQGQEAPVVILSLGTSGDELDASGIDFILDANRLNVAISRAQALTIIVGDPDVTKAQAESIENMANLNRICRIKRAS